MPRLVLKTSDPPSSRCRRRSPCAGASGEPIEVRLWARTESDVQQRAAKLIARWFQQIGLKIKPEVMDDGVMSDRMQPILYEESPHIVTVYPADTEARNVGKWDGWVRAPAETGGVWYRGTIVDSYLNLKPRVAAQTDGGGNTGLIVGIVVAAVVVLGIVARIVLRRTPKAAAEE